MAGDIGTAENVVILEEVTERGPALAPAVAAAAEATSGRVLHRFGPRVLITEDLAGAEAEDLLEPAAGIVAGAPAEVPRERLRSLDLTGRLGIQALALRQSPDYRERKARRPLAGALWDTPEALSPDPIVDGHAATPEAPASISATSGRLAGSIAVGVIIVEGPTDALRFTDEEQATVVAEVQNGLSWLATQTPGGSITWSWDVHVVEVGVQAQPLVALWAQHSDKVVDIAWGSHDNGAELIQWDWNGGHNQHFSLEPLDDGHYRLVAEHSGKVLDVENASLDNGARIIQWDWHGGDNQRFRLEDLGDGTYRLVAKHSGRVLDVSGASTGNWARIIQWDWNGGDNQRFRLDTLGGEREDRWRDPAMVALGYGSGWGAVGNYVEDLRRNLHTRWAYCGFFTKYPLGHFGYASIGGPRIVMDYAQDGWGSANIDRVFAHETGHIFGAPDEYSSSQCDCGGQWGYYQTPNENCERCAPGGGLACLMRSNDWAVCEHTTSHWGWPTAWALGVPLFAKHSGRAFDIANASTGSGAELIQWDWHGQLNQRFRLDPLEDGHYRIVARHSSKVLDVSGASLDNGARIIQWDWNGGDNQRFRLESLDDGHYRLVAKHSGKVLDVENASAGNWARIIQWDWNEGDNQRFRLPGVPVVARNSGKVLDVYAGSHDSGAELIQWDHHGGANQRFRLEPVGRGDYRLVAEHSGKVLDVENASLDNGARIIQWDWHGGDNQRFRLESLGGSYRLVAKHSRKVLDVYGASLDNGARIIQWDWHGGDNQRFRLLGGPFTVKHTGKVLDVTGASLDNGARIIQWDWHGEDNQRFRLEALSDGHYRLVAEDSGKVLDVYGGSRDNGAELIQWDWNGGDNQRFRLDPLEDGFYRLVAKHSGKVLDVYGALGDSGARIIQWDWHGGDNQCFRL